MNSDSGAVVGNRYRLVRPIATGGMGTVWEGWDERLQRRVAVKQVHPQPGVDAHEARLAAERALREARNAARLHHPNAVPVYDVVEDGEGRPCVVMQYLPARSLQQVLADSGPLPAARVAGIGRELASALAAAHAVGIVHRDVKPGNVLIDADGSAKLTDFGISHASGDPSLTSTGMVTGTPAYLAPEVARGAPASPASDVFSLGSTLYTAAEGISPFGDGQNAMATLHRAASGLVEPPRNSGPLTPVLQHMLAVDPGARPAMADVAARLADVERMAADPTRRLAAPPVAAAPAPPPSSTVAFPPVVAPVAAGKPVATDPPGRNRAGLVAAILIAALILAGVAILLAQSGGGGGGSAAGGSTSSAASTSAPHSHSTTAAPSTKARTTSSTTSSAPSSAPTTSAPPATSDPATAVQKYYDLLPDNTDAAWNLLTPHFQQTTAGGRDSYDSYWASVQSVDAKDAQDTGKNEAVATIDYVYRDGRTVSEQTRFTFVSDGGVLKIDRTEAVSGDGGGPATGKKKGPGKGDGGGNGG